MLPNGADHWLLLVHIHYTVTLSEFRIIWSDGQLKVVLLFLLRRFMVRTFTIYIWFSGDATSTKLKIRRGHFTTNPSVWIVKRVFPILVVNDAQISKRQNRKHSRSSDHVCPRKWDNWTCFEQEQQAQKLPKFVFIGGFVPRKASRYDRLCRTTWSEVNPMLVGRWKCIFRAWSWSTCGPTATVLRSD